MRLTRYSILDGWMDGWIVMFVNCYYFYYYFECCNVLLQTNVVQYSTWYCIVQWWVQYSTWTIVYFLFLLYFYSILLRVLFLHTSISVLSCWSFTCHTSFTFYYNILHRFYASTVLYCIPVGYYSTCTVMWNKCDDRGWKSTIEFYCDGTTVPKIL